MLDNKRSQVVEIAIKKLPQHRHIKAAIVSMNGTLLNKDGIEVSEVYMSKDSLMVFMHCCLE